MGTATSMRPTTRCLPVCSRSDLQYTRLLVDLAKTLQISDISPPDRRIQRTGKTMGTGRQQDRPPSPARPDGFDARGDHRSRIGVRPGRGEIHELATALVIDTRASGQARPELNFNSGQESWTA